MYPPGAGQNPQAGVEESGDRPAAISEDASEPHPAPAPTPRRLPEAAGYLAAGCLIALTQGLGSSLISSNIPFVGGEIGTTSIETTWLVAAFMAPRASLPLLLIKIRTQYGLRRFAEVGVMAYVVALVLSFWMHDLPSAIAVQFLSGVAAAPMSTLGFLYILEAFPPARKMSVGLATALTLITLGSPLARFVSPALIDTGAPHVFTLLSLGLALACTAFVLRMPLTPQPRARVIGWVDVVSYLFIAVAFGGLTVVFVQGASYWWTEAPWLGELLAASIAALTVAVVIELNREAPLVDIRWLTSPAILHFTAALLVFRVILSEQTSGAPGLFQQLGLGPSQMQGLFGVIIVATLAGGAVCAAVMKPGREGAIHLVALMLIAGGAWHDSQSSLLTRPEQMYVSQAVIAFAAALFLPPALLSGLMSALAKGPTYILSFVIVFLTTQSLGGAMGAAVFRSFVTLREKVHLGLLTDGVSLTHPAVTERIGQIAAALAPGLPDPGLVRVQAVAQIGRDAATQAYVMAYNDAFRAISVLALGALAILSLHLALRWADARRTAAVPA